MMTDSHCFTAIELPIDITRYKRKVKESKVYYTVILPFKASQIWFMRQFEPVALFTQTPY